MYVTVYVVCVRMCSVCGVHVCLCLWGVHECVCLSIYVVCVCGIRECVCMCVICGGYGGYMCECVVCVRVVYVVCLVVCV